MLLNCGVVVLLKKWCFWTVVSEKTLESPLDCKEIKPVHPKGNQSSIFIGRTDAEAEAPSLATWCEELTHLKRPRCWERLRAGGEGDSRGWDGWMASPTWWTWVWPSSGSWWWTGKPGMLQSMGSQSWTQLSHWTELNWPCMCEFISGLSIVFHWSVFILIPCWLPQLCNMVWNKAWRPYCSYCIFHTPWASQVVLVVKNLPANEGDVRETSSIPGLGRSPGGQGGNSLQYSCLENPRDKGVWRATVHGVAQCQTWLKWLSMHAHAL